MKRAGYQIPLGCPFHTPPGKKQGSFNHTNLCDHVGDIASVGGQQEGVGVFCKIGEGIHILLCH